MANGKTAIVFPGQGSQRQGMGKDFYESIPECRRIYEEASDALGWDVAALCFGEDEKLNLTAYAQPGIVVTEIAMLKAIMENTITTEPLARLQYVSCANPDSLLELEGEISSPALLSMAVFIGKTRLIDNCVLS